ncbi:hypothetical protein EYF80_011728 [Liparis tanakae]|uniref:Uncharacterized protein n=1 Tax=Liparis tanakae TaxID=230148 RepID=A0A4Z2IJK7_9TELE|nr:hypothetical protein EYF80_011728 [Liparis tanakae]
MLSMNLSHGRYEPSTHCAGETHGHGSILSPRREIVPSDPMLNFCSVTVKERHIIVISWTSEVNGRRGSGEPLEIKMESALKPVDLSRPEGSDIYQIPAQGNRGDYKLLIEVERKETHTERERRATTEGERKKKSSPLFFLMPRVKRLQRPVGE